MKKQVYVNTIPYLENKDHVGFIDTDGKKAFIIRINGEDFIAVTAYGENSHMCYGSYSSSIKSALMNVFNETCYGIDLIYKFDTRKELYQWLAE